MAVELTSSALDFAVRSHARQVRDSDGAPFIEHPLEVARLLRDAGCSADLVVAGLLHDIVEDTGVGVEELERRFGPDVTGLVRAVSDDEAIEGYRERKRALREQVRTTGGDAAMLFAADKISKVRELGAGGENRANGELRLEHYQRSLEMLRGVLPGHQLVARLEDELARFTA